MSRRVSSRAIGRATCAEEVEDLLEYLLHDSRGLRFLKLAPVYKYLRKSKVSPFCQTEQNGDSLHLTQECEGFWIARVRK